MVLIAQQLAQVHIGGVVEALPRGAEQERVWVQAGFLFRRILGKHLRLGRLKHTIQTPQHREGQYDLAIVGLLVIAP